MAITIGQPMGPRGPFKAQFPGTCQACGAKFPPTTLVVKVERTNPRRSGVAHADCANPTAESMDQAIADRLAADAAGARSKRYRVDGVGVEALGSFIDGAGIARRKLDVEYARQQAEYHAREQERQAELARERAARIEYLRETALSAWRDPSTEVGRTYRPDGGLFAATGIGTEVMVTEYRMTLVGFADVAETVEALGIIAPLVDQDAKIVRAIPQPDGRWLVSIAVPDRW